MLATPAVATAGLLLLAGLAEILDLLGAQALASACGLRQLALGAGRDLEAGVDVIAGRVRLDRVLERQLEGAIDHLPSRDIGPVDEGDGRAIVASAARATDPMQVRLLVVGALVVDDVRDVVDVDAAN